ncbi:sensor histidine kinase [Domibacillus tundrae]|uniref:sensor histidine kinase n=1 Tax=Domibacillus tundrae TaxID=1587527 RepID=UPI003399A512
MKWNSITVKLGGSIIVLFLVVLLPLMYTIDQLFTSFYTNQQQKQTEYFAGQYSAMITDVEDVNSYHMFDMLSDLINADFLIFNKEGVILRSTAGASFQEGSRVMTELFAPIAQNRSVGLEYTSSAQPLFLAGKPIVIDGEVNGGLVVASNMDGVQQSIKEVRKWLFVSAVGALLIAVGFTYFISRRLASPLLQMEKAARDMARGKLSTVLPVTTRDEVGTLAVAINDLGRELKQYRTSRSEFFANISHELRTPISYIKGYSEVLRKGMIENEAEKQQYAAIIEDESKRLTALINDLFELAKMEEGKLDLHPEWVEVDDVLKSAIAKARLKASEKKIDVIFDTSSELLKLHIDPIRLEQAVLNIVENAIRYSEVETNIHIYTRTKKSRFILFVKDEGMGIQEEDIPFIFERFYRVEKSRSRASGGTGLGLAIVKNLVERLNGDIQVESEIGKGTEFILSFPLERNAGEEK